MSLPLEQFLSAVLLRIFPIQNFVPRTLLSLRDVGCRFLLGYNALQVQFADTLKQSTPRTIYMLRISQGKRGRNLCQQPPKFLLAVQQSLSSQILPVTGQQIECKEARRVSTVKHQVFELWSTTSIERTNFAVNDRSHIRQRISGSLCRSLSNNSSLPSFSFCQCGERS